VLSPGYQHRLDSTTDPRTKATAQTAARKVPPRSALPRALRCPTTHVWNTRTIARNHT
jgi:citrate synthase